MQAGLGVEVLAGEAERVGNVSGLYRGLAPGVVGCGPADGAVAIGELARSAKVVSVKVVVAGRRLEGERGGLPGGGRIVEIASYQRAVGAVLAGEAVFGVEKVGVLATGLFPLPHQYSGYCSGVMIFPRFSGQLLKLLF